MLQIVWSYLVYFQVIAHTCSEMHEKACCSNKFVWQFENEEKLTNSYFWVSYTKLKSRSRLWLWAVLEVSLRDRIRNNPKKIQHHRYNSQNLQVKGAMCRSYSQPWTERQMQCSVIFSRWTDDIWKASGSRWMDADRRPLFVVTFFGGGLLLTVDFWMSNNENDINK